MRSVFISRCDAVGNPLKKPTPGQETPGLEPGISRVQSGALGAWPRCSVKGYLSYVLNISWAGKALETVNCCAFLKRRLIGAC
jgi:hypothetical protein